MPRPTVTGRIPIAYHDDMFDALARIVKEGFERMETRFEAIDQRFTGMDFRFDRLEGRVDQVERNLVGEIKALREELPPIQRRGDLHEQELADLSQRMRKVEEKVGQV